MGQRLVITEEEKKNIQEMYGINHKTFLFENEDILKNDIEDSFDENPESFSKNIINKFPILSKFKNDLSEKINFIMSKGTKSTIIPLVVSLVIGLTSCVQNPNSEKCKSNKPKNELEKFRVEFEKKHTNYNVDNDILIGRINDTLANDFTKIMNDINWDSIPMMIDRIEIVDGKSIIHFGYGGIELSNSSQTYQLVNIEFFAKVTEEQALQLEEEKYYRFDFEIIKRVDINNYENFTNRNSYVFYSPDIKVQVSDSSVIDDSLVPPYFKPKEGGDTFKDLVYSPMEITLGAWLVKIKSISPL